MADPFAQYIAPEEDKGDPFAAHLAPHDPDDEPTEPTFLHKKPDVTVKATTLAPRDEERYQQWKKTLPPRLQYEGDYDLRGFWQKNPNFSVGVPGQHMTDEFKLPNHPTFSNESKYYSPATAHLGGHWEGDKFVPNDPRYKAAVDETPGAPGPDEEAPTAPSRKFTPFNDEVAKLNEARARLAPDGRSFLHRAADTVATGAKAVAHVGSDIVHHPLETLKNPAKRREFERGLDDMVTLGYGQKLAARVGNALGDTPDVALGPETFGRGDVANTQESDVAAAPEYRTAGNVAGAFVPGAARKIGEGAGRLVGTAVPVGLGGLPGNVARSFGAYEAAAPVTAALSANAEGNRLEAAKEAATDPAGLLAAGIGGTAEGAANRVLKSEGAKARELIERNGRGAKVGVLSPGSGGVFDRELAGVAANDKGIGTAAKRSAEKVLADLREQHKVETSKPYKALKEQIDNRAAKMPPRDVTSLVTLLDNAVHDLDTAPFVRAQLREQLDVLNNRYRDPTTGIVMLPERQLNGLRRTLSRAAKIGTTDAPGEAEAPLRAAAFEAKKLVDAGPYESLNRLYAEGAKKLEEDRKSLGLKGKPPKDAALDARKLKLTLLREKANTQTGGGDSDIAAFRANHPEQARNLDLTELARARAALGFHVAPVHGGLMERAGGGLAPLALGYAALTHPLATAGALAVQNATPLAGRVLYRPARALRAPAFGGRLGAARGAVSADDLRAQLAALGR